jgi:rubrerythrin
MVFCYNCGHQLNSSTEKFCPNCGQNLSDKADNKNSFNISDTKGDVFGVGFSGSGNIIGKNIVVGSGTINVSKQELAKVDSEYANALQDFSDKINQQLNGRQIPEEQVKEINNRLNDLTKEVEGIKPGQEEEIDYEKQKNIEAKTGGLIQRILKVLPQAAETVATFTPLAPFSKLIGKGIEQLVDEISKRKK